VGVHAPPELTRLAGALDSAMALLGFPREERPFAPHLTLGSAKRHARPGDFRRLAELAAAFGFSSVIEARTVDLMRSHLSQRSARYECLLAAPLAGAGESLAE
jgi:2'-5' RNA ligase